MKWPLALVTIARLARADVPTFDAIDLVQAEVNGFTWNVPDRVVDGLVFDDPACARRIAKHEDLYDCMRARAPVAVRCTDNTIAIVYGRGHLASVDVDASGRVMHITGIAARPGVTCKPAAPGPARWRGARCA
jgi:hypothetical protein